MPIVFRPKLHTHFHSTLHTTFSFYGFAGTQDYVKSEIAKNNGNLIIYYWEYVYK